MYSLAQNFPAQLFRDRYSQAQPILDVSSQTQLSKVEHQFTPVQAIPAHFSLAQRSLAVNSSTHHSTRSLPSQSVRAEPNRTHPNLGQLNPTVLNQTGSISRHFFASFWSKCFYLHVIQIYLSCPCKVGTDSVGCAQLHLFSMGMAVTV